MHNTPRILAHAANSRAAFDRVESLGLVSSFTPEVKEVWASLRDFYNRDPQTKSADTDAVFDRLTSKFPRYAESFNSLRSKVLACPLSETNFYEDLREQLRAAIGVEMINAIGSGKNWERILELVHKVEESFEDEGEEHLLVYNNADVGDVVQANDPSHLTQLHPLTLNECVGGGVPSPCHILVYARPDMGKTSFMLNLVKGFCKQGKRVLYYNNEDNPDSFLMRSFTVFTGQPKNVVIQHPDKVKRSLDRHDYHNLHIAFSEQGSMSEIEKLVSDIKPDVVIIDQIRNLSVKGDSRNLELEVLARGMRTLARRHKFIGISVSQAGDSAEGKSYLGMSDLDYSKTGVQGAVDLMIAIGASEQDRAQGYRCVALPKNKFSQHRFAPKLLIDEATGVYSCD